MAKKRGTSLLDVPKWKPNVFAFSGEFELLILNAAGENFLNQLTILMEQLLCI
jgi:hypothetical protein